MRIQFSRQEKGLNTNADLCQPRHSGSVPANRLLLCDGVDIGSGIEAQGVSQEHLGAFIHRRCTNKLMEKLRSVMPHGPGL
ncbi:hypothetical protein F2P81_016677 [Scophthalmus maximus]|uniref:Uncharacterized protein n=1 Tax=Scophthalmus maximus TaxID=52904 RepID=A0A6A4SP58_SCOMX|nr:hypothetical protein F2P81_016677 [Scophthalmus maximus]